jgi:hypothetical protein
MPAKPGTVYTWATSAAAQDKVAPTSGEQAAGYAATQPPAHNVFNALLGNIFDWLGWLSTLTGADVAVSGTDARTIGAAIATADANIAINSQAATTSALGRVKMSTAPADAASPIAVGSNDTRMAPTGTSGAGVVSGGKKIQSGKFTPGSGSDTTTFPTAFASAPVVTLSIVSGSTASPVIRMTASPTATGFSWQTRDDSFTSITVTEIHWQAIGA